MAPQQHPVTLNSWLQPPQPPEPAASSADPVGPGAPASSPPATAPPRLPKRDDLSLPPPVIPEVPQAMEAAPSLFEMGPGGSAVAALVRVRPFSKKEKRSGAPAAVVVTAASSPASARTAQLPCTGGRRTRRPIGGGHPSLGVHRPGAFAERILYNGLRYSSFSCGRIIHLRMHIRLE